MYLNMPDHSPLFVRRFGQGQPVLVLSGLGMTSNQWLPFLWPLRQHFDFIIPDWRGFGGSQQAKIPSLDAIKSHWQDLNSICQQLKLNELRVIAYSMGATTAMYGMQYANFAERICSYLHIDQSPCIQNQADWSYGLYGEQQTDFFEKLTALRASLKNYQSIQQMPRLEQQQVFYAWQNVLHFQGTHSLLLKSLRQLQRVPQLGAYTLPLKNLHMMAWYLDTYLGHDLDLRPSLHTLNCPITWLSGQNSTLYPVTGQALLAEQLKATHVILPKSGHAPLVTEPLAFYQTLRRFLMP